MPTVMLYISNAMQSYVVTEHAVKCQQVINMQMNLGHTCAAWWHLNLLTTSSDFSTFSSASAIEAACLTLP